MNHWGEMPIYDQNNARCEYCNRRKCIAETKMYQVYENVENIVYPDATIEEKQEMAKQYFADILKLKNKGTDELPECVIETIEWAWFIVD